jgi:hypothetical protein
MKSQKKRKRFADIREVKINAGGLEQHQRLKRFPEMFSAVGRTLVEVYRVKRGIL